MIFDRESRAENENTWNWIGAAILIVLGLLFSNYFGDIAFAIGLGLAGIWGGYFMLYLPHKRGGGNTLLDFFIKRRDRVLLIKGMDLKIGNEIQRAYRISPSNQKGIDFMSIFKAMRVIDVTLTFSEVWTEEPYHRLKRVLRKVLKTAGLEHRRYIVDYIKSIEDAKASPMNILLLTGRSADVDTAFNRLRGYLLIEQIPWKAPVARDVTEGENIINIQDGPNPSIGCGNYFKVLNVKELPGGRLEELITALKSARVNFHITPNTLKTKFALKIMDDDRKSNRKKGKQSTQGENLAGYKQKAVDSLETEISDGLLIIGISIRVIINAEDYDSLENAVRNLTENVQIAGFDLIAPENQATALGNVLSQQRGELEKDSVFFLPVYKVEEALSSVYLNPDETFLHGYPIGHDRAGFAVYLFNMGRCLIAGDSGSGKSVGTAILILNTILEKIKRVVAIDHAGNGQTENSIYLALKRAIDEGYLKPEELTVFDFSDDAEISSRINIFRVFDKKDTQREFEQDLFTILSGGLTKGETKKVMHLRKKCSTFSELVAELEKINDSDLGDRLGYWEEVPSLFGDDSGPMFKENKYVSYNLWNISSMRSKIAIINIIVLIEQMRSENSPCEIYLEEAQDLLPGDPSLGTPTIKDIVCSDFRKGRKFLMDVGLIVQDPQDLITGGLKDVLTNLNTALIYSNVSRELLKIIGIENNIDIEKEGKTGVALLFKKRIGSVLVHIGISPLVQNLVLNHLKGFIPPLKEESNRFYRLTDILPDRKENLLAQGHMITTSSELGDMEAVKFIHHPALNRERAVLTLLVLEQIEKYLGENVYLYDIKTVISGGYIVVSKKGHQVLRLYAPDEMELESILAKIDSWNGKTVAVTRDESLEVNGAIYSASKIAEALPTLLGIESH